MWFKKRESPKVCEEHIQDKKWERSYRVSYGRKQVIVKELTYDFFAQNIGWEWMFDCRIYKKTISIAITPATPPSYEFAVLDWETNSWERQDFDSSEELLMNAKIHGKTIKELWEELEN